MGHSDLSQSSAAEGQEDGEISVFARKKLEFT